MYADRLIHVTREQIEQNDVFLNTVSRHSGYGLLRYTEIRDEAGNVTDMRADLGSYFTLKPKI